MLANAPRLGITAVGIFLCFGATMALLAGITLVWPHTGLNRIWVLNPQVFRQLSSFGRPVGALFLWLAITLGIAAVGWFRRRDWGWKIAVAIVGTQVAGDLVNTVRGDIFQGAVGFMIASALLFYMLQPKVRAAFVA